MPNTGTVYGAPEPVKSDRQLIVTQRRTDQGEIVLHSVFSRFVLKQGEEYEVTSSYSLADAEMLRNASENYPQWVVDSYLQVPEEITPETRRLAVDLTAGLTNQFDKAIAVRNYLRENIAYNDQIAAPPDGVEPVHYILFEDQEAYCNYYASAMIMMLRSVGVPARFVTGYTQGEWDEDSNSYRVRANNSHAWTEVYFPQYGWIPFEATASIPAGNRSELLTNPGDAFGAEGFIPNTEEEDFGPDVEVDESAQLEDFLEGDEGANADSAARTPGDWLLRGGIAAAILSAAIALSLLLTRANRRVEASVEGSYSRLGKWAPWLGVFIQPAQTPYERANELVAAVPEGKEPIRNLTYQYVRQLFSQTRAVDEGFDPQREWNSLRFPMIRRTIRHQLRQLRRRIDRGNDTG